LELLGTLYNFETFNDDIIYIWILLLVEKSGKIYSFDIWGLCVSRDIFGITNDSGVGIPYPPRMKLKSMDSGGEKNNNFKYVINNYLESCSIAAQFSEHVDPELTMKD
jgi:hypothetical protein